MFKCYHRCHHGTETVLLKVRNNVILLNMNKQHVTILVLLDLSAAFNTVNHEILLESMTSKLSIRGTVLSWFRSYLSRRSQRVAVDHKLSKSFPLDCGVPQGSCLGPLLLQQFIWNRWGSPTWSWFLCKYILNYTFHSALVTLCVKILLWLPWRPALQTSRSGPNRIVLYWTMIKLNLLWSEPVSN